MAQEKVTKALVSVEFLPDSQTPVVSSLQLAEHFGIKHAHVLRDIRAIQRKAPEIFSQSNFGFSEYTDCTGRALPVCLLTRDGFTLLAMGYNSPRALAWKIRYIATFNALEQAVLTSAKRDAFLEGAKAQANLENNPKRKALMQKALAYRAKGLTFQEVGKLLDLPRRTANDIVKKAEALGFGKGAA